MKQIALLIPEIEALNIYINVRSEIVVAVLKDESIV